MGRTRGFDTAALLVAAGRQFAHRGYEGTSVDDLVRELGVHRGSLYSVFGSKRGLFLAALEHAASPPSNQGSAALTAGADPISTAVRVERELAQDVLLVALTELAPHDLDMQERVERLLPAHFGGDTRALGVRLLTRAGMAPLEEKEKR